MILLVTNPAQEGAEEFTCNYTNYVEDSLICDDENYTFKLLDPFNNLVSRTIKKWDGDTGSILTEV